MSNLTIRDKIQFILNGKLCEYICENPHEMLIDYLRARDYTGTKEGCKEGDCGACTLLMISKINGKTEIKAINSCITLIPMIDGCEILSIDGLKNHIIQEKMIKFHGSQCGFCTPGFVMSLAGHYYNQKTNDKANIQQSLSGNLCRCTGYTPILHAAQAAMANPELYDFRYFNQLPNQIYENSLYGANYCVARNLKDALEYMKKYPNARIIAGATDIGLWINKKLMEFSQILFIHAIPEICGITENNNEWHFGAGITYSNFYDFMRGKNAFIDELLNRFAGHQVRNLATIGGNIANGSPIGDGPPLFIAMNARLKLISANGERIINLQDFFIEYGKQDKKQGEIVHSLILPKPKATERIYTHKITKRKDSDISAVMMAMMVDINAQNIIENIRICYGGMAGIPKRADKSEQALIGKKWALPTMQLASEYIAQDFQPLSDMRASQEYRALAAKNLLTKAFLELNHAQP